MDTRKCLLKQHKKDNDDGDPPIPATPSLAIPEKVSIAEDASPSLPMESVKTKEVQGGQEKLLKRNTGKYVDTAKSKQEDVTKVSGLAAKRKMSSTDIKPPPVKRLHTLNDDCVPSITGKSSVTTPPIRNTKSGSAKGVPCARVKESVDAEYVMTLKPGGRGSPVGDRSKKLDGDEGNVDGEEAKEGKSDSYTKQVEKIAIPKLSPQNEENKEGEVYVSVAESIATGVSLAKRKKEIVSSLQPWIDKYAPKTPKDVIGNQTTVKYLYKWLKNWKDNLLNGKGGKWKDQWVKKAVLLSGAPGTGKTTSAKLVSEMLGFRTIELNAGVNRGKADSDIKELVNNQSLGFNMKRSNHPNVVLIMDEVDAMVSAENDGLADLISSIKVSKIPIICICNDQYKLKGLVRLCSVFGFQKPTNLMMGNRLKEIANSEGVQVAKWTLIELARRVNGDMRMAVNQLQYMSLKSDTKVVESNDIGLFRSSTDHLTAIDKLFGPDAYELNIDERFGLSAIDADLVPLHVQENYINYRPRGNLTPEKLLKKIWFAADSISSGDMIEVQNRRYQKRQLMLQSSCLTTSVIPAAHLRGERYILKRGEKNLNRFGGWLGKDFKMRKNYRLLKDASLKFNIDRSSMCLDYLSPLLEHIAGPLKTLPKDKAVCFSPLGGLYVNKRQDVNFGERRWI